MVSRSFARVFCSSPDGGMGIMLVLESIMLTP